MSALIVLSGLLESIRLATTLIEKLDRGELTPEEAAAEWDKTSTRWSSAAETWNRTQAPGEDPN